MKFLYIVCHPNVEKSFNHRLTKEGVSHLKSLGQDVKLLDLYECKYDPLIIDPEHEQMKEHLENLLWSEIIIIQFPLYWWSCPASVKGYIDYLMPLLSEDNKKLKRKVMLSVSTGGKYSDGGMNKYLSHLTDHIKNEGDYELIKTCYQFGVNFAGDDKKNKLVLDLKRRLEEFK